MICSFEEILANLSPEERRGVENDMLLAGRCYVQLLPGGVLERVPVADVESGRVTLVGEPLEITGTP